MYSTQSDGTTVRGPNVISEPLGALLDTGNPTITLPPALATALFASAGYDASYVSNKAPVPCDIPTNGVVLTFGFNGGGAFIDVPFSALINKNLTADGSPVVDQNGNALCYVAIDYVQGWDYASLGDSFLRSAYVVYDLEDNTIGLGQAVLNATSSAAQAITSTIVSAQQPTQTVMFTESNVTVAGLPPIQPATATTGFLSATPVLSLKGTTAASQSTTATASAASASKSSGADTIIPRNTFLGLGGFLATLLFF